MSSIKMIPIDKIKLLNPRARNKAKFSEIVANIAEPSGSHDADVRDRDIGRFGEYFAGTVLGVGMVVPFLLTLAEFDYFWIANAMYLAFVVSALIGSIVKLVAYRRGL